MKQYMIGLYEKALPKDISWEKKFFIAKKYGYDFIEISIDETDEKLERLNMSKEQRFELVNLMRKYGISIKTMCLSGHRKYPLGSSNAKIREKSLWIMEKALDLADDLGIKIIQIAGYDVYYESSTDITKSLFEENLEKITQMASKKGIILGFETMETDFMNTVEKAMKYVKKIDSPYLNIYPDLGNITNSSKKYKIDLLRDLESGKGHLVAMHLKETLPGQFRDLPFGEGHVDFECGIKKAWELGIRQYVTEFWYSGSEQWEEEIERASKKMCTILNRFN